MATPLSATYRAKFVYTVNYFPHTCHLYCKAHTGGSESGYEIDVRSGAPSIDFIDIALGFWNAVKALFPSTGVTFTSSTLEHLSGTAWNPVYSEGVAVSPTGTGVQVEGTGVIATLRDPNFKKIRVCLLETEKAPPDKTQSPSGWSTAWDTFGTWLTTTGVANDHGYDWIVGRSNQYISTFVSFVADTNDKIRRGRFLT